MAIYRWGIVGPGNIAGRFAEALTQGTDQILQAVASRNISRAQQFAEQFSVSTCYDDYQQLADDPNIDVIYISTPHNFHFAQACLCLKAKKHLLIEKPVCMNSAQLRVLLRLAEQNNVFLMEAMWSRFLPSCQQAKQWILAQQIGTVQSISSTIGFAFDASEDHRCFNMDLAGGALLDLGVYSISLTNWFFDDAPAQVVAHARKGPTGADYCTQASLRYTQQRLAQFMTSVDSSYDNQLHIHGTRGHISLKSLFFAGHRVSLTQGDKITEMDLPHDVNGFEYQIREVVACLDKGDRESQHMSHQASLDVMNCMDEIRHQIDLFYADEYERCE